MKSGERVRTRCAGVRYVIEENSSVLLRSTLSLNMTAASYNSLFKQICPINERNLKMKKNISINKPGFAAHILLPDGTGGGNLPANTGHCTMTYG